MFGSLRIVPREDEAMENLTLYTTRLHFPEGSKVIYGSKDGKEKKIFDA
jgi:hypothetical protein